MININDKAIISTVLVFDEECLYTLQNPTAFESVAVLLAAYFVYQIEFPEPYIKPMQTMQHLLHGERNHHKLVKNFFKTFNRAKKILKPINGE